LEEAEEKMEGTRALGELTEKELDHVSGGQNPNSPNQHVGGGPGGSGNGDKHAPPNGPLKVGPS